MTLLLVQFPQSVLAPAGPQAATIGSLWWFILAVATVVFVAVMVALLYAVLHRRPRWERESAPPESRRRATISIAVAGAITVAILFTFLVADFGTLRALSAVDGGAQLTIELIGHQWWWQVEYPDSAPQRRVSTANEIHIPVGRPVMIKTTSRDVIHSFWAPNLHGKRDLVPGHQNALVIQADTPGVYRAQCAEYCGHQHAKMALFVVAESEERFQEWLRRERALAAPPIDSITRRGQDVFLQGTCVMCHAIKGTPAGSRIGPDLTHLASRLTIGAGTLPNTRGNLAGWITDPQTIKPGVRMPPNALTPSDLQALLAYLETLR
jgi:cytochrome c oxidase subunit 2